MSELVSVVIEMAKPTTPANPNVEAKSTPKVDKPFACHGEPHPGKPCMAKLSQAEAWVPTLAAIRKMVGRWPSLAKDLADHIHCGRCAALGRKAGLRFYRYPQTVVEMERRRAERTMAARQAFHRYL